MRRQTSWKLSNMKLDERFGGVDWKMLNEYLPDKLLEELDEENSTTFHQQLSSNTHENSSPQTRRSPCPSLNTDYPVRQSILSGNDDVILSISDIGDNDNEHDKNIRNELVIRFLTAMSIDYEKQWYLGMIRRKTLDILIKSIEQAKHKCSLELHWKLILQHFRLSIFLRCLLRFDHWNFINQWTNQFFFDHIFRTIELTLSKYFVYKQGINLDMSDIEIKSLTNIATLLID